MIERVQIVSVPGLPDWVTTEVTMETRPLFNRSPAIRSPSEDLIEVLIKTTFTPLEAKS